MHDVHLPRLDIGCDRAKRYGQLVEVPDVGYGQRQVAEYEIELLPLHNTEWQVRPSSFETDIKMQRIVPRILLASESQVAALRLVGHRFRPVHFLDQSLQLLHTHARRVQAADDRTHARARNGINRYMHALEFAQHANVRGAAGTASAKYQPYSQPVR